MKFAFIDFYNTNSYSDKNCFEMKIRIFYDDFDVLERSFNIIDLKNISSAAQILKEEIKESKIDKIIFDIFCLFNENNQPIAKGKENLYIWQLREEYNKIK